MKKLIGMRLGLGLVGALGLASALSFNAIAGEAGKNCDHHGPKGGEMHMNGGMGMDRHFHQMDKALNLTDAQKTSAKALREGKKEQRKANMDAIRTAHKALADAADSGAKDAQLKPLADKLAKLQAQDALERAQSQREFIALLTPEQKQKMTEMKAKREAKMAERKTMRESKMSDMNAMGGEHHQAH
jgi:periplasmic protein CpxP/Spy